MRSCHAQLHDAAEAFATCTVPYKRLLWVYDAGGADELDELEDGGPPRDPANLMSTCRSHHSVIHARRRGGKVA